MAVDLRRESVTLTVRERTRRIDIIAQSGEDPRIIIRRETLWLKDDGTVYRKEDSDAIEVSGKLLMSLEFGGISGEKLYAALSEAGDMISALRANGKL